MKKVALVLAVVAMYYLPAHGQLQEQYQYQEGAEKRATACWEKMKGFITHGDRDLANGVLYSVRGAKVYSVSIGEVDVCEYRWKYEGEIGKMQTYKGGYDYRIEFTLENGELCIYSGYEHTNIGRNCIEKYQDRPQL